ncbi:hydrocephalus-inducing protein homolog [Hirundo rustica]|uniref:hydrocephalus-inducing protein homolog n=1 Tax=Hirundo rustica TaxID=43150 RepID=UPI002671916E|nr:hydrocephalus-inducing protein homolog [Hirundo rustica]
MLLEMRLVLNFPKKPSDVLTLQYQPLTIKNTCSLPLDLMLSLERPFHVCNANRQPLPDGQPVTVDVKQTCRLYIAFDPAYKLDFNSWKEEKVLKIEMVRGHPSVEEITLWGEVHFPNLQIQPSTLEFGCVMAGTEEVHSLEMTNCSPLPVKYHWAFQTDSQANRVIYELHPPKFKPKPPKVKSIYVEHLPTQWRRFRIRNVEEPATTLEESRDLAQSPGAEVPPHAREKRYIPAGLGRFRYSMDLPHKVAKAFSILPLSGVLQPGERQQVSFTFFGHLNTIAGVRALCHVEGGPTYKVELTGGASRVSYSLSPREIDCGLQLKAHIYFQLLALSVLLCVTPLLHMFNEIHHSTVTLENTCKVKFSWVINPSTADRHLPGVFLVNPNFPF